MNGELAHAGGRAGRLSCGVGWIGPLFSWSVQVAVVRPSSISKLTCFYRNTALKGLCQHVMRIVKEAVVRPQHRRSPQPLMTASSSHCFDGGERWGDGRRWARRAARMGGVGCRCYARRTASPTIPMTCWLLRGPADRVPLNHWDPINTWWI